MSGTDPVIHGIAELFVDELIEELPLVEHFGARGPTPDHVLKTWRAQLVNRAAHAMQQALEGELNAIRQDYLSGPANRR